MTAADLQAVFTQIESDMMELQKVTAVFQADLSKIKEGTHASQEADYTA